MSSFTCARCYHPNSGDPLKLWDGKEYCSKCAECVSPELKVWALDDSLTDTLERRDVHGWYYLSYMWPRLMLVVLALAAIPMMLGIAGQQWQGVWAGFVIIASIGAFAFMFLGLQAILGHFVFRFRLPRVIALKAGEFTVTQGGRTHAYDLKSCKWQEGATMVDQSEMFTRLRSGIVLYLPNGAVALGHSPGSAPRWRALLQIASVPRNKPLGCARLLLLAFAGLVLGCAAGIAAGLALTAVGQPAVWKGMLGFLGAIDGMVIALVYWTATSQHTDAARKRLHPLVLYIVFGLVGAKIGFMGNWNGVFVCATLNAVIGLALGIFCRLKIQASESERSAENLARLP